jgi:protein-tyrosine phosphatase
MEGNVESAGFSPTTINDPPGIRAVEAAEKHNLKLEGCSRIFVKKDFERFDKIFVMDTLNYREVKYLAKNKEEESKIDYLMNVLHPGTNQIVPDPNHIGTIGMDEITDLLDKATDAIVDQNK